MQRKCVKLESIFGIHTTPNSMNEQKFTDKGEENNMMKNKCKMEKAGSYHCNELMPADGTDANKGICSRQF